MLDIATLRLAFAVVAACALWLSYGVTYRSTRAPFSGWWSLGLVTFVLASLSHLSTGTPLQGVGVPLGYGLGVSGAGCTWAAARSLRDLPARRVPMVLGGVVVAASSVVAGAAHDFWAGAPVYLVGMSLMLLLASRESRLARATWRRRAVEGSPLASTLRVLELMSATAAGFYALRCVVLLAVGPRHSVFVTGFGPEATTLVTLVLLVLITFSMTTLSHAQQTAELQARAAFDDLTGLRNRAEFLRVARLRVDDARSRCAVVVADLDHFKHLNDGFGHAAGDRALALFGQVCRETLDDDDLVGRLGGDEFVVLTDDARAVELARVIGRRFSDVASALGGSGPDALRTVSFGIAGLGRDRDLLRALARADDALYRAKAGGRARAVRWEPVHPSQRGRRSATT